MRYCGYIKRLCPQLVFSESVTFTAPNLIIDLPAGAYNNCQRYCVVITDAIPADTTREAPVFFTIGGGAVLYPFVDCNGNQLTERSIDTRTRYSVVVNTTATGGAFKLLGRACVLTPNSNLAAIDGTAPAEGGAGA